MTEPNNAGAGAPPVGAANTNANNGATSAGANTQQMVPITALHEERDKRQALAGEVEALKDQMENFSKASNANANNNASEGVGVVNPPVDQNQFHADLDQMWREDPRRAMQTELMMAVNWRDQVDAKVDEQVDNASTNFKDFNNFQGEVRKYIRRLPVEQRSKPGIVEAAYFMVKGRNADSYAKAEADKLMKKAQAGDGTQSIQTGASSGGGEGTNAGMLNADQKSAAAAMGVSEDEYAKYMKK
jgi:hypothetical protein